MYLKIKVSQKPPCRALHVMIVRYAYLTPFIIRGMSRGKKYHVKYSYSFQCVYYVLQYPFLVPLFLRYVFCFNVMPDMLLKKHPTQNGTRVFKKNILLFYLILYKLVFYKPRIKLKQLFLLSFVIFHSVLLHFLLSKSDL